MIRMLVLLTCLADTAPADRRSEGFAGSAPVGLDGYVAFAKFDCARINTDRRRSRQRVPLFSDCPVTVPAPNGGMTAYAAPAKDDTITLSVTGGLIVAKLEQPTVLLWNPTSRGLLLNDSEGSGQVSHLRYFFQARGRWRESRKLTTAADALYRRRFDCRAGRKSYTNVSGWDWTRAGALRVIVQEGVHSEGCRQPHEDRNVLYEVIGDPVTGRVSSAREIETLP